MLENLRAIVCFRERTFECELDILKKIFDTLYMQLITGHIMYSVASTDSSGDLILANPVATGVAYAILRESNRHYAVYAVYTVRPIHVTDGLLVLQFQRNERNRNLRVDFSSCRGVRIPLGASPWW